ncbi:MAG: tetratricopeptide repeat protein [Acidobacteriota bacterium]
MSVSYGYLGFFGFLSPNESVPQMKSAAASAIAIDSGLAESHLCLASLNHSYEWDWPAAEREFKRALELNPGYAEAHELYGWFLALKGRVDEALAEASRALELDPISLIGNLNVGWTYFAAGQYDLMHEQGRKLIEIEPNFFGGYHLTAVEFWTRGRLEEAIAACQKAVALAGGPLPLAALGCLYGLAGERDKAQQVLDQLRELSAGRYVPRYDIALVYAGLGEMDRAFECLEQACEQREGILLFLKHNALLIPGLSTDPPFADLLLRVGLSE